MKTLLINGSPRLGNSTTLKLTHAFLEGYGSAADLETEEVAIHQLDFKPCAGCLTCWKRTPGKCIHQDEASEWIEKTVHADVLIWSFPLFFSSMPGKTKMFLDRQCCTLRPNFLARTDYPEAGLHGDRIDRSAQKILVFGTCGHFHGNANFASVRQMFDLIYGTGRCSFFFFGEGEMMQLPWVQEQFAKLIDTVKKAGVEYARSGMVSEETRAKMEIPVIPDREAFETQGRSYYAHLEEKAARKAAQADQR